VAKRAENVRMVILSGLRPTVVAEPYPAPLLYVFCVSRLAV
jgi:hypothetical protein